MNLNNLTSFDANQISSVIWDNANKLDDSLMIYRDNESYYCPFAGIEDWFQSTSYENRNAFFVGLLGVLKSIGNAEIDINDKDNQEGCENILDIASGIKFNLFEEDKTEFLFLMHHLLNECASSMFGERIAMCIANTNSLEGISILEDVWRTQNSTWLPKQIITAVGNISPFGILSLKPDILTACLLDPLGQE